MTKPITLHTHEVRRLLDRGSALLVRPVKPQPDGELDGMCAPLACAYFVHNGICTTIACPLSPGLVLWVRERFCVAIGGSFLGPEGWRKHVSVLYPEGNGPSFDVHKEQPDYAKIVAFTKDVPGDWRGPVTMPKWASRLSVVVQAVTVKRVNELTTEEEAGTGFDDDIPAYNHTHFQNDWLARYGRRYDDLWRLWVWGIELKRWELYATDDGVIGIQDADNDEDDRYVELPNDVRLCRRVPAK